MIILVSMRLKSVKNIQKITKSMKMVSAAKYAQAERGLKVSRPYGEALLGNLFTKLLNLFFRMVLVLEWSNFKELEKFQGWIFP